MIKTGILFFSLLLALLSVMSCGLLPLFAPAPLPTAVDTATATPLPITSDPTMTIPASPETFTPTVEIATPEQIATATEPVATQLPTLSEPDEFTLPEDYSEDMSTSEEPTEKSIEVPQSEITVQLKLVAMDLRKPVDLVSPPDESGRLFIVDQSGVIYIISSDGEMQQEPFLDLRSRLSALGGGSEAIGLKALAFHPSFTENGRFYIHYRVPYRYEMFAEWDTTDRISEITIDRSAPNKADAESERILLEIDTTSTDTSAVNLVVRPGGLFAVQLLKDDRATEESVRCINLSQSSVLQATCLKDTSISQSLLGSDLAYMNLGELVGGLDVIATTKGRLYQGYVFPSLWGRYIFGGYRESDSEPVGRIFIAAPPDDEGQNWEVEELVYSLGGSGLMNEVVSSIRQDATGELYLLTSQEAGVEVTSKIYQISPKILSQRSTIEDPKEYLPLTYSYARAIRKAPVYRTLADVRNDDPFGTHGGGGNYWVSVRDSATVGGRTYYRVSWGWGIFGWISASNLSFNVPLSHLRGVDLAERAGEPFAMAYQPVNIRTLPGVLTNETIIGVLQPYDVVTVLEMREVDGTVWYRIGPDQWTHSNYLRVFVPSSRPEGVEADEKWVEVNLSQQVVIAHEGDTPVFATLTSTGRPGFETEKGLYRAWAVLREAPMQWLDSKNPYSLANVPWIMYFNQGQGLHGTYWHDLFGTVRSAGCVNLSPRDAYWLFHWAGPELLPGQRILYPNKGNPGVWVWVHDNRPDLQAMIDEFSIKKAASLESISSSD